MTDTIYIRRANKSDCEDIFKLWVKLGKHHFEYMSEKIENNTLDNIYASLIGQDNCLIYVAVINEFIIGFAETYIKRNDLQFYGKSSIYILHMFIEEDYRDTYAAYSLFYTIEKDARINNIDFIYADVFNNNKLLYEKMNNIGFQELKSTFYRIVGKKNEKKANNQIYMEDH